MSAPASTSARRSSCRRADWKNPVWSLETVLESQGSISRFKVQNDQNEHSVIWILSQERTKFSSCVGKLGHVRGQVQASMGRYDLLEGSDGDSDFGATFYQEAVQCGIVDENRIVYCENLDGPVISGVVDGSVYEGEAV